MALLYDYRQTWLKLNHNEFLITPFEECMKKIVSNEQSYQSIYINPFANNWQEVIVFHEPIFEDEIPGVIALKSLRLERCLGFVLAAPKSRLRYFREKIKDVDIKEELGKKEPRDILKKLLLLSEDIGGSVVYIQNEFIEEPKEDLEGIMVKKKDKKDKKDNKDKKEPKKKENLKSKQQNEADISSYSPEEKKIRILNASQQRIYSPSKETCPNNIHPNGIAVWQNVVANIKNFEQSNTKDRWELVRNIYEKRCQEVGVNPYKLNSLYDYNEIKETLKNRIGFAFQTLRDILPSQNTVVQLRLRIMDAAVYDEEVKLIAQMQLINKNKKECVVDGFRHFVIAGTKNLVKQVDQRTNITITENNQTITASILYTFPRKEAEILTGVFDETTLKNNLLSVCNNKLFSSRFLRLPVKNSITAITEEKAAKIYLNIIQQKEIDGETLQTAKEILDDISDIDLLFKLIEVTDQKRTPKERDFVITDSLKRVDQKKLVEKINEDIEAKQMFLFHGLEKNSIKDLHLSIPQIRAVATKGYRDILVTILNDVSKYSDDALENILECVEYSNVDEALSYLSTVIGQDRVPVCTGMVNQIIDEANSSEEVKQIVKVLKPIFKQMVETHVLYCIMAVSKICKTLGNEKNDDALALISTLNDNIKEDDTQLGDESIAMYLFYICQYLFSVGVDTSKFNMFYLPFIHGGLTLTNDDEDDYILPYFFGVIKNLPDKINKLIEENKIKITNSVFIFSDSTAEFIKKIKDTPLWDKLWEHFRVNYDNFSDFFDLLTREQKDKIINDDFMYGDKSFLTDILDKEFTVESTRDKAVEVAVEQLNNPQGGSKRNYYAQYLSGFSSKEIVKKLYDKLGMGKFIYVVDQDGNLDDIEDRLKLAGVDIENINYNELLKEGNPLIRPSFYCFMGQYKLAYEHFPALMINWITVSSDPYKICNILGVHETIKILKILTSEKEKLRDSGLVKLKPLFTESEAEISESEFETLLQIYKGDSEFCKKLIDDLSDDELKHFTRSSNNFLRGWALSEHNPSELLNLILDEKSIPVWFQTSMLANIPPKLLREFNNVVTNNSLNNLETLCAHIIRNLYPDEYLHSRLATWFFDATPEQKSHFVDTVGEGNLDDKTLEKLQGKRRSRYEKTQNVPKLPDQVIHDKLELLRLILPLAKSAKAS